MKSPISNNHPSYLRHRRQFWLQIFLPMIVAVLAIVAVSVLAGVAAFGQGDAPRWAAVSTIWLVIPVMFFGLIFLAILIGLVYMMVRALQGLPPYTSKAQYYVNRGASEVKRFSDMAAKPVLFIEGIIASIKAVFGKY